MSIEYCGVLVHACELINSAFNPDKACDTVHSQTRRMITVEPEPDFWIHAVSIRPLEDHSGVTLQS